MFHGRVTKNVLELKKGISVQQSAMLISQIGQGVFEQKEMVLQDVQKNVKQSLTNYKAYFDKNTSASKIKERNCVFVLKPQAEHQGSRIFS